MLTLLRKFCLFPQISSQLCMGNVRLWKLTIVYHEAQPPIGRQISNNFSVVVLNSVTNLVPFHQFRNSVANGCVIILFLPRDSQKSDEESPAFPGRPRPWKHPRRITNWNFLGTHNTYNYINAVISQVNGITIHYTANVLFNIGCRLLM